MVVSTDPLQLLNHQLVGLDDKLFPNPTESSEILIVGIPRSGTTLISQLICSTFDVGYINNLAATFWNAPAFGVTYAQKFVADRTFLGQANYGLTTSPSEPHEFGAYWRDQLGYEDMVQKTEHSIDWLPLFRSLDQIGEAWGNRPVCFKVFQLAWHLVDFFERRKQSKWIRVTRDPVANTESLMKLQDSRDQQWVSAVPSQAIQEFSDAPAWQKAAAQVGYMTEWLDEQFNQIPLDRQLCIRLDDLISDPAESIQQISSFIGMEPNCVSIDAIRNRLKGKPLTPQTPDQLRIQAFLAKLFPTLR